MRNRYLVLVSALAAAIVTSLAPVVGQAPTAATSTSAAITGTPLRTPWGEPDLQGVWNGQTLTPLERPARFAAKPVVTEEEAARLAKQVTSRPGRDERGGTGSERDVAGAYNAFWQGGPTRLTEGRTALIVDPPDGRIPPSTPEAQKRAAADRQFRNDLLPGKANPRGVGFPEGYNTGKLNRADGPEDRNSSARCLGGNLPDFGAFYQIVQSPGYVAIFHDTGQGQGFNRIIPINGSPHLPQDTRQWWGDARGRWEGNTLVVDITNFTHKTNYRGSRENLHLVERFTRVDANTLNYELTVEDPTTWTRPWTLAVPWTKESDKEHKVLEPTCHVGNYGLLGILSGARADEKAFAEGRGPDPATMDIFSGGPELGLAGGGIEREE